MLLSDTKKFIFIHNYKVAGNSISDVLARYTDDVRPPTRFELACIRLHLLPQHFPSRFPWHITATQLRERLKGTDVFEMYYKFGLVRNPWDWQVSLYTFMLKTHFHPQHKLIKKMKGFDEYVDWRVNQDLHLQKEAFYDAEGKCLMDFIGKMENIDDDFKIIGKRLGIDEILPHSNRSREDNNFLQFYSKKTVDVIANAYQEDMAAFGYAKPNLTEVMRPSQLLI